VCWLGGKHIPGGWGGGGKNLIGRKRGHGSNR